MSFFEIMTSSLFYPATGTVEKLIKTSTKSDGAEHEDLICDECRTMAKFGRFTRAEQEEKKVISKKLKNFVILLLRRLFFLGSL